MIRAGVVVAGVVGIAVSALGQPGAGTTAWMPMDGEAMCAMMSREMRGVPVRDLVTVTVETGVEKKTDTFEVFITPVESATARLDLVMGPLHVHADGSVVRAVHTRAADTVFEAEVVEGKSALDVIAEVLPPIPMPQVWMALSADPDGKCPPLGAYIGEVEWIKAEMSADAHPPKVRMYGYAQEVGGKRAQVELYATVQPVRITSIVVRDPAESFAMEIRVEPLEKGAAPPEDSMEGRRKVGSVPELVPADKKP